MDPLDENSSDKVSFHEAIKRVYYNLKNYAQAMDYLQRALEIACRIYKQSHPIILDILALVIIVAKEPVHKCKSLKQTYTLCVEILGAEHELTKELFQLII